jgi:hypothetical protein
MDNAAFVSLETALAHHNEWEGQSFKLSVHESPEMNELVDADLAQCPAGKAPDGTRF